MRTKYEMQGPDIVPEDIEDEVYILNKSGTMVKMEVPDDSEEDGEE